MVHSLQIVEFEALKAVWLLVMVHCNHQGTVEFCVAEKLYRMRIRVPWELEPITLKQKHLQTY